MENNDSMYVEEIGRVSKSFSVMKPKITVIGVGGGGTNAVNNMVESGLEHVNFIVCNTDWQALELSPCKNQIKLGPRTTKGLGAGSDPAVGEAAAQESLDEIMDAIEGSQMLFITAGAGGGTGSGAAPVIAKAARDKGVLTIGFVTRPFTFEGKGRAKAAQKSIEALQECVDCLIIAQNQHLLEMNNANISVINAFSMVDSLLCSGVGGIVNIIARPGVINVDFQDAMKVMKDRMSRVVFGVGVAEGEDAGRQGAEIALSNPLLEMDEQTLKKVDTALVSVTGGPELSLQSVEAAVDYLREQINAEDDNIIVGMNVLPEMSGKVEVCIFASCPKDMLGDHKSSGVGFQKDLTKNLKDKLKMADKFVVEKDAAISDDTYIGKPHLNLQEEKELFSKDLSGKSSNKNNDENKKNQSSFLEMLWSGFGKKNK